MDVSRSLPSFAGLVLAVGVGRLVEMSLSRRRRRALHARGASPVDERHFPTMVLLHAAILGGSIAEAWLTARPIVPWVAIPALALVLGASLLRWWVIATLGLHWNVRIMSSLSLGVITDGPYRFVRHPNYVAVFVELAALPLVHGAYVTALAGAAAHAWVLAQRIRAEEAMLDGDAAYRASMGNKPRFVPYRRVHR